jgi:hypothetical protein
MGFILLIMIVPVGLSLVETTDTRDHHTTTFLTRYGFGDGHSSSKMHKSSPQMMCIRRYMLRTMKIADFRLQTWLVG